MNWFLRATLTWAILIAAFVWLIVYLAALVGPIAGVGLVGDSLRGRIKAISENVFFILLAVSLVAGWVRDRRLGPGRPSPHSPARYGLPWGLLLWVGLAAGVILFLIRIAFGEDAVPLAVTAAVIVGVPAVIYRVNRHLKKHPLQRAEFD